MEGTLLAAGQIYGVGTVDASILVYLGFLLFSPLLTIFFYMGSLIGTVAGKCHTLILVAGKVEFAALTSTLPEIYES